MNQKELKILNKCFEKSKPKPNRRSGVIRCEKCKELNKGIEMVQGFTWNGSMNMYLKYDEKTKTILIAEEMLMHFIQLANPLQPTRKIELFSLINDE